MKVNYELPTADIVELSCGDVLRTSCGRDYIGEWDNELD